MSRILLLCAGLAWAAQAQTVTVTATPPSLSFTYQAGSSTLPAAQTVSVKASKGTPTFTTAINPSNTLWVTASPDSGKLPGTITVRVNPTSLPVGTYNNPPVTVVVTVSGVATPVSIPVNLTVTAPPSTLTVSPTALSLTAPPVPVPDQTVTLSTNGAPISFTATSGSPWLTVSPSVGVVLPGAQQSLTLSIDPSALTPQTAPYTGKITVVGSGAAVTAKSQTITVSLTVNSVLPTITSIWPATLPVNAGPQTITVRGTSFYGATVAKVQGVATPLTTTVLSSSALLAVVPATMLTTPATLKVLVSNPPPGGDSSTTDLAVANVPVIYGVTSSASYASASISPGELVTIFGSNIGPAQPASMVITNGYIDTAALGGVSVTIDGKDAPLIYASQSQVTLQVPYEVTQGAGKQVVLTNGTNPDATATVTIAATAPGLFSADGSGSGQAAALNLNTSGQFSLNGSSNMAKIGDTVILYLTGEGNYNATPLSGTTNTGYIIPDTLSPLPQVSPAPTVTIGGVDATSGVAYAGPIPGSMLGLLQVNVVVPTGSTTGTAVPVIVTIGGNSTQANLSLAIHP